MSLPKYFVIETDRRHPLWKDFIAWLGELGDYSWTGDSYHYYGYDGNSSYGGTNGWHNIESFMNNPTLITLEEWYSGIQSKITVTKVNPEIY